MFWLGCQDYSMSKRIVYFQTNHCFCRDGSQWFMGSKSSAQCWGQEFNSGIDISDIYPLRVVEEQFPHTPQMLRRYIADVNYIKQ